MTPKRLSAKIVPPVLALALAISFLGASVTRDHYAVPETPSEGVPWVRLYDPPENRLEAIVNQGDGQAFAALAQDPLLRRPDVFRPGKVEAAYRAQRPLLGWLAWVTSMGNSGAVPAVLIAWSAAAFVSLAAAAATYAVWQGKLAYLASAAVLVPGALVNLNWTGPETLGTAASVLAVGLWQRGPPRLLAVTFLLVIAVLCRETFLVIPLAVLLHDLWYRRLDRRRLLTLIAAPAVYGCWVLVVFGRLGAWPFEARGNRLSWPGFGVIEAAPSWNQFDILSAFLALALVAFALVRRPRSIETFVISAHLAFASCLGASVWARAEDFSRVLLPLYVFALLASLPPHRIGVIDEIQMKPKAKVPGQRWEHMRPGGALE